MPNSLTRNAGLRLGPVVLETLVKHYFDRIKKEDAHHSKLATQLHHDELLYHEAFNIVKGFLEVSTHHTVEEVQAFSNNKTPSPPWVHVVHTLVPISCCDQAAIHITKALGGAEFAKRIVGGTKWWQVRGVQGVDAEWITARKDYLEEKKRRKAKHRKGSTTDTAADSYAQTPDPDNPPGPSTSDDNTYKEEMDEMRCILYAHGGGYYFGSVDQERYSIQRHARKIQGRVFAINYRLAPQYPFPCALQDILAAYLYLINPPSGSSHRPVKPEHIVVAGDSAGGGLTIALLQVLRDTGLPLPAGGVLISPWCDLTHSFPSIHKNTPTDVIPQYGLSFHKPSPLWPPPPDDMTREVHLKLRERIQQMVQFESKEERSTAAPPDVNIHQNSNIGASISLSGNDGTSPSIEMPVDVGTSTPPPSSSSNGEQTIRLQGTSGNLLVIKEQIHLYTQNSLIGHPLISPAFSYLGGLPPLFFIASDKEVLRDEIIYTAHKAADPSRFSIKEEARSLYPPLIGIEQRYNPTSVHLQVYDDTAHVLPVLFSFTTPGKFCYRAIASFVKHVTKMSPSSRISTGQTSRSSTSPPQTLNNSLSRLSRALSMPEFLKGKTGGPSNDSDDPLPSSTSPTSFRSPFPRPSMPIRAKSHHVPKPEPEHIISESMSQSQSSDDANVANAGVTLDTPHSTHEVRFAGEYVVYCDDENVPSWNEGMIRERVSTRGEIRPLEPESNLEAFAFPLEILGAISERAMQRYLDGKVVFDKKFAKDIHDIQKQRDRNLELSRKDAMKSIAQLQGSMSSQSKDGKGRVCNMMTKDFKEGLEAAFAWALDADEYPPPSSIVSRRDTTEARRLARIADQAVLQEHAQISANSLWAVVVNFLTDRERKHAESATDRRKLKKRRSLFTSLRPRESNKTEPSTG